jgi:FkbM family methyltransferase
MTYDIWQTNLRLLLPSPKRVIDAGANTGQTVARYRQWWPSAEVHCIEPVQNAYRTLEAGWGRVPGVHLHRRALGASCGHGEVFTGKNTEVSSLLPHVEKYAGGFPIGQRDACDVVTLDAFLEEQHLDHVDLLKMDLQGGELAALEGAQKALERSAFDVILSEVWLVAPYEDAPHYWEIACHLAQFDYLTWWINVESYVGMHEGRWGDALFISRALAKRLGYG